MKPAYYNEITAARVLPACNSSGRAGGGRSGIGPTQVLAIGNSLRTATALGARLQAYVQPQGRAPHHNSRKREALTDWSGRSVGGCCPAAASPSFAPGKSLLVAGDGHGRSELILQRKPGDKGQSKATCSPAQGLSRTKFRRYGRRDARPAPSARALRASAPCIALSNTADGYGSRSSRPRTQRTLAAGSCRNYPTYFRRNK